MTITKVQCLLSLAGSGLNFTDFERYNKFFMNTSIITLSQAGSFKGPTDISEYVSFASYASSYFGASSTLPSKPRRRLRTCRAGSPPRPRTSHGRRAP